MCRAGYLPQNIPLEIMRYLSEEKDFLPWHAASRALYPLDKLLDRTENYNIFNVRDTVFLSFFLQFFLSFFPSHCPSVCASCLSSFCLLISRFIAKILTVPQSDTVNDLGILTFFLITLYLNIAIIKLWLICIWTVIAVVWAIYD